MVMLYFIIVNRNRLHPAGNQLIGKLLVDAAYHTVSCRFANNTAAVVREPQDIKIYEGIESVCSIYGCGSMSTNFQYYYCQQPLHSCTA